jgi:hypothetical protein
VAAVLLFPSGQVGHEIGGVLPLDRFIRFDLAVLIGNSDDRLGSQLEHLFQNSTTVHHTVRKLIFYFLFLSFILKKELEI